jgi:hypothetical protein
MRVTDCVRHLLAVYDRPDSNADGNAVLEQLADLLHALASRPVSIEIAEDAEADWQCVCDDAFVVIGLLLFDQRETIRRADRIDVTARRLASNEIAVELLLSEFGDRPASAPEIDAGLVERLARAGVRVERSQRPDPRADTFRIVLRVRN